MAEPRHGLTAIRLLLGLALLVGGAVGIDWLLRVENYPVKSVRFEGPFRQVQREQLEAAVMGSVRGNFFLVDLDAIKQRVESIPWVHRASVRRSFPNEIAIAFTEQKLVARWGAREWVNASGEVVQVPAAELPAGAPTLAGPGGTSAQVLHAYRDFATALGDNPLRVRALTLTPRRVWRIELQPTTDAAAPPFVVMLDRDQPERRLERFARLFGRTLGAAVADVRVVDLRYTNGFSVEWRSPQAAARALGTPPPARVTASLAGENEG
ncbi:MAG: cell division protein FtsQ/DivIB [Gammaproteobacteria bacterium]